MSVRPILRLCLRGHLDLGMQPPDLSSERSNVIFQSTVRITDPSKQGESVLNKDSKKGA